MTSGRVANWVAIGVVVLATVGADARRGAASTSPKGGLKTEGTQGTYSYSDASGTQKVDISQAGAKRIKIAFQRVRGACSWQITATARYVGSEEIEDADGYPIFFEQYRLEPGQAKCEILIGIEEKTAKRVQVNVGKKCGDTCLLDNRHALMTRDGNESS